MGIQNNKLSEINKVYAGPNLASLKLLPDNSVDICVTSPPYFGLRDYGTAIWLGGNVDCDHKPASTPTKIGIASSTLGGGKKHTGHQQEGYRSICVRCGAERIDEQVGLEETPELYVKKMVEIFEEVRRVLKPTGTLWLNLGDSYAGGGGASGHTAETKNLGTNTARYGAVKSGGKTYGLKPKDLIGIPWMVAYALRDAGWYLRSDIIWYKKNPMPESVTDRPSKSHEYIFLLSKNKQYYYDSEAIKTAPTESTIQRMSQQLGQQKGSARAVGFTNGPMKAVGPGKNIRPGVDSRGGNLGSHLGIPALPVKQRGHERAHQGFNTNWDAMTKTEQQAGGANKKTVWEVSDSMSVWKWMYSNFPADLVEDLFNQYICESANKTDVWDVTTKPFKEAHFATFPQDLIIDCIKAGTSEHGNCADCGAPYERVTEPLFDIKHTGTTETKYGEKETAGRLAKLRQAAREAGMEYNGDKKTVGWKKTCTCDTEKIEPAVVLDIFDGAGTTRLVSRKLARNFIAMELNPEYIKIGDQRMIAELGMFL